MASLSQTLRQRRTGQTVRGPGGQLSQETPEEIQTLAGRAGLQAPPTTALGAAVLGANPDQQKMQGTPAQKQAALSLASAPVEQGLAATLRRQQARTEQTAEEQAQTQKNRDMDNLGGLGDRVTQFIEAQRQQLQTEAQQAAQGQAVDVRAADQFQGKDISRIKNLLAEYRANPTDQTVLLELNTELGYNIDRQLSPQEVDQLYESTVQSIARGGAGNVDNDLTVSDLVTQPEFGYTPEQLSELLGLPPESVNNLTVGQLRGEIERVGREEFSTAEQIDQQAVSGQLGQAERAFARGAGREASATGVRATEADYANLEQQISAADKVLFGGQEYTVDELLKDETISQIITEYMELPPESPRRKQLEQFEPALVEFITKNQAVIDQATQQMRAGAQTFQDTQTFNRELQTRLFGGVPIAREVLQAALPGWGGLSAERVNVQAVPLLRLASERGPEYSRSMANNLNQEVQTDPSVAQEVAGLDFQTLQAWDIGNTSPDSAWKRSYVEPKAKHEEILNTSSRDIDNLVRLVTGGDVRSAADMQKILTTNNQLSALGLSAKQLYQMLDSDGDGTVDNGDLLKGKLLDAQPRPSLSRGPNNQRIFTPVDVTRSSLPDPGSLQNTVLRVFGDAASKGVITPEDIEARMGNELMGVREWLTLNDMLSNGPSVPQRTKNKAAAVAREKVTANTRSKIGELFKGGDPGETSNRYVDLWTKADSTIDRSALADEINRMLAHELVRGERPYETGEPGGIYDRMVQANVPITPEVRRAVEIYRRPDPSGLGNYFGFLRSGRNEIQDSLGGVPSSPAGR